MELLVVLGGGESGVGTAILGKQKGYQVFVSDKGKIKEDYKKVLKHFEIEWEENQHTVTKILTAAIVMKSPGIPDKVPLVKQLVANGVSVISEIEFASKYTDATIVGITGSNGKTTTKELINAVLTKKYNVVATSGNLNNHIGVPLTLLSMTNTTEIGIVEMGANHHNEIAFLSQISSPDYGYITNFGKAHLEGFGSVEGVIKAKSELYDYVLENNKKVFVNPNDTIQLEKTTNHNRLLFVKDIKYKSANPFVTLTYKDQTINTNLIGDYNYNNIAAAITIGNYFKINDKLIIEAIKNYIPKNNRSQIIKTKNNEIILDAYNANPSSMEVAIKNFAMLEKENKILVLGDMFELGENSLKEHQYIIKMIEKLQFKSVYLVGENFYLTKTKYLKYKKLDSLLEDIEKRDFLNNTFLIKGSRGMTLEKLIDFIN